MKISDVYSKKRYDRRFINVDPAVLNEVKKHIDEYNETYGEGSVHMSEPVKQSNGKGYSFTLNGRCIAHLLDENTGKIKDYEYVAVRFNDRNADSKRPAQFKYFVDENSIPDDFRSQMIEHQHSTECSCCGRTNNRRNELYILSSIGEDGKPTGEYIQYGSSCIDKQGGSAPFLKLLSKVNKTVDEYHQRVERNNSTMIEPKSFLACAIVSAKYSISDDGYINAGLDSYHVSPNKTTKRDVTNAVDSSSISGRARALYRHIDQLDLSDEFSKKIHDEYDRAMNKLDELSESGVFDEISVNDRDFKLGVRHLDETFGGMYAEKEGTTFIDSLNYVYPISKSFIHHDLSNENVYSEDKERIDVRKYMACAYTVFDKSGYSGDLGNINTNADAIARIRSLYDNIDISIQNVNGHCVERVSPPNHTYAEDVVANLIKIDNNFSEKTDSDVLCDAYLNGCSSVFEDKLVSVIHDQYVQDTGHWRISRCKQANFTEPSVCYVPEPNNEVDYTGSHDAKGSNGRYKHSKPEVSFDRTVDDAFKKLKLVCGHDLDGRKCYYFGANSLPNADGSTVSSSKFYISEDDIPSATWTHEGSEIEVSIAGRNGYIDKNCSVKHLHKDEDGNVYPMQTNVPLWQIADASDSYRMYHTDVSDYKLSDVKTTFHGVCGYTAKGEKCYYFGADNLRIQNNGKKSTVNSGSDYYILDKDIYDVTFKGKGEVVDYSEFIAKRPWLNSIVHTSDGTSLGKVNLRDLRAASDAYFAANGKATSRENFDAPMLNLRVACDRLRIKSYNGGFKNVPALRVDMDESYTGKECSAYILLSDTTDRVKKYFDEKGFTEGKITRLLVSPEEASCTKTIPLYWDTGTGRYDKMYTMTMVDLAQHAKDPVAKTASYSQSKAMQSQPKTTSYSRPKTASYSSENTKSASKPSLYAATVPCKKNTAKNGATYYIFDYHHKKAIIYDNMLSRQGLHVEQTTDRDGKICTTLYGPKDDSISVSIGGYSNGKYGYTKTNIKLSDADNASYVSSPSNASSHKRENVNTKRSDIKRDTSKDGQEFSDIAAKANEGKQLDWDDILGPTGK